MGKLKQDQQELDLWFAEQGQESVIYWFLRF
jgi:hypothetical protein